jgi:hypothetical protein
MYHVFSKKGTYKAASPCLKYTGLIQIKIAEKCNVTITSYLFYNESCILREI